VAVLALLGQRTTAGRWQERGYRTLSGVAFTSIGHLTAVLGSTTGPDIGWDPGPSR
jgi:hypothetical protein